MVISIGNQIDFLYLLSINDRDQVMNILGSIGKEIGKHLLVFSKDVATDVLKNRFPILNKINFSNDYDYNDDKNSIDIDLNNRKFIRANPRMKRKAIKKLSDALKDIYSDEKKYLYCNIQNIPVSDVDSYVASANSSIRKKLLSTGLIKCFNINYRIYADISKVSKVRYDDEPPTYEVDIDYVDSNMKRLVNDSKVNHGLLTDAVLDHYRNKLEPY